MQPGDIVLLPRQDGATGLVKLPHIDKEARKRKGAGKSWWRFRER